MKNLDNHEKGGDFVERESGIHQRGEDFVDADVGGTHTVDEVDWSVIDLNASVFNQSINGEKYVASLYLPYHNQTKH